MSSNPLFAVDGRPLEIPPRPSHAQRIERAEILLEHFPASSELLHFYASVAAAQQRVFESLPSAKLPERSAEKWPLLLDALLPLFSEFASAITEISPLPMRERVAMLKKSESVGTLLTDFWGGAASRSDAESMADRCIALAFLQPYAEWLALAGAAIAETTDHATCPVCASEPVCAVLRDQDHGARRGLICSLCMNEWNFPRVLCPSCGEKRFELLPVFTPEGEAHVRVDACDTCKQYIKTVDLTKDGLAVAVVDEMAAASLDLWAQERGYTKLVLNLAGL